MATPRTTLRCGACGATPAKWAGQCADCGGWNTISELTHAPRQLRPSPLCDVGEADATPRPTGVDEFDRVVGGGLVAGSVTLCFGEPGIGKSTLLLQVAIAAAPTTKVLLICAEESAAQVRARAARLGELHPNLLVLATTSLEAAERALDTSGCTLVIVDSIQALSDPASAAAPGSPNQVRICADRLAAAAKLGGVALIMVGHVTKDGDLAGPRSLEHLVDTVVSFEGDRHHTLRIARALKHRFGTTGEVGLFEMGPGGLLRLQDPAQLLLADRRCDVPGSAIAVLVEGRRPLVTEIQTLCVPAHASTPRRAATGLDSGRLTLLLAVLEARAEISFSGLDVFASVAGGLRATEPAADLPLAIALVSAATAAVLSSSLVAIGEVGLAGEVRQVPGIERRLGEAARLGFTTVLAPPSTPTGPNGLTVIRVGTLEAAIGAALDVGASPQSRQVA